MRGADTFVQNIQNKSTLKAASWDEDTKIWTLCVLEDSQETQIQTRHFVLAIGGAGQTPKMPQLADRVSLLESFFRIELTLC